jgi:transcriptional regulator with XRE-family HTH domain
MGLVRFLLAPSLLIRASTALGLSQSGFGELLGVSRRTITRWQSGDHGPSYDTWIELVRHVYPRNRALAVEMATELEETLVSLGVEAAAAAPVPEAPAVVAQLPLVTQPQPQPQPPPAPRPLPPIADLVDSIVCAAAEAVAATPQAMRPALLAAFERAASLGLEIDAVRAALRPGPPQNSG